MSIARQLVDKKSEVHLGQLAATLDVDVRTIWNWKRSVLEGAPEKKIGRPTVRQAGITNSRVSPVTGWSPK